MSDIQSRIMGIIGKPQLSGFATDTEKGHPWVGYVVTVEPYCIEYCSPGSFIPEVWEK